MPLFNNERQRRDIEEIQKKVQEIKRIRWEKASNEEIWCAQCQLYEWFLDRLIETGDAFFDEMIEQAAEVLKARD